MLPRTIEVARQAGIEFPTIRPLFSSPPYQEVMQTWVAKQNYPHISGSQGIAQKIVDNVNHVSFEKFLAQLKQTVAAFNTQCKEPYILLVTQDTLGKLQEGASEQWVAGLALEACGLRCPEEIVTTLRLESYLAQNPNITKVLILDDAAYSGTHMCRELDRVNDIDLSGRPNFTFYVGIPFMTTQSVNKIADMLTSYQGDVKGVILPHSNLAMIEELLTKEELVIAKQLRKLQLNVGLTYFDHKMPDFRSIAFLLQGIFLIETTDYLRDIENITPGNRPAMPGKKRIENPEEWGEIYDKFEKENYKWWTPRVISPYKLHSYAGCKSLEKCLSDNRAGERTNYPIPTRYTLLLDILKERGIHFTTQDTVTTEVMEDVSHNNTSSSNAASNANSVTSDALSDIEKKLKLFIKQSSFLDSSAYRKQDLEALKKDFLNDVRDLGRSLERHAIIKPHAQPDFALIAKLDEIRSIYQQVYLLSVNTDKERKFFIFKEIEIIKRSTAQVMDDDGNVKQINYSDKLYDKLEKLDHAIREAPLSEIPVLIKTAIRDFQSETGGWLIKDYDLIAKSKRVAASLAELNNALTIVLAPTHSDVATRTPSNRFS